METLLEVRRRSAGIALARKEWPETVHWIVQLGPIESRLILPKGQRLSFGLAWVLLAGLGLGIGGGQ